MPVNEYTNQLISCLRFIDSHLFPESPSVIVGLHLENEDSYQYEDPLLYVSDIHEPWLSGLKARLERIPNVSLDIPHLYVAWAKGVEKEVNIFLAGKNASKGYFQLFREMAATRVWMKVRFCAGYHQPTLTALQIFSCLPQRKKQEWNIASFESTMNAFPSAQTYRENSKYKCAEEIIGIRRAYWYAKMNSEAAFMGSLFNTLHSPLWNSEQDSIGFFKKCKSLI